MGIESKEDTVDMNTIYDLIEENNKKNRKFDLADIEDMLQKGESPPDILEYDDMPKSEITEIIITESKTIKPKKPWEGKGDTITINNDIFTTNEN